MEVNPKEKVSLNKMFQDRLVDFLRVQDEWMRSDGRDHVILAHHPNSMLDARMRLYSLTLEGAIYHKDGGYIRQQFYYTPKDEKDVHFSFGSVRGGGMNQATKGMHSSKFCLDIAGNTPSSNRLFDAIAIHSTPFIIIDGIELPYEDVLDYSEFCIFIRTCNALKEGFVITLVRSITKEELMKMWKKSKEIEHHFEYQYPSQGDDAVQIIWKVISHRIPSIRLRLSRSNRFRRSMAQIP